MTVSADPSPEPGELEQQVAAVIDHFLAFDATGLRVAAEVISIVREAVAKEIEAEHDGIPASPRYMAAGGVINLYHRSAYRMAAAIARGHR